MQKYLVLLLLLLSPARIFAAEEVIPPEFIDQNGMVCVTKSCSGCQLQWLPFVSKNTFNYACPEMVLPACPEEETCKAYLPKSVFRIPPLEGAVLDNCSQAIFPDRMCSLRFDTAKGISWSCENQKQVVHTPFKAPLCMKNLAGDFVNVPELTRLSKAEEEAKMNAQSLCLKKETSCAYAFQAHFPRQTHPPGLTYFWNVPKFDPQKMKACKNDPEWNRAQTCSRQLTRGELPKTTYEGNNGLLAISNIERAPDCVRYENRNFAFDLLLSEDASGQLTWTWRNRRKEKPDPEENATGPLDSSIMRCKSFAVP